MVAIFAKNGIENMIITAILILIIGFINALLTFVFILNKFFSQKEFL